LVLFGYHLKPGNEYVKNIYTANQTIKYLLMEAVSCQAKIPKCFWFCQFDLPVVIQLCTFWHMCYPVLKCPAHIDTGLIYNLTYQHTHGHREVQNIGSSERDCLGCFCGSVHSRLWSTGETVRRCMSSTPSSFPHNLSHLQNLHINKCKYCF